MLRCHLNATMSKGILCAIDFSDTSKDVLRWSVELAQKLNEHLTVLYTYRLLHRNGGALEMKKKMESDALKNFSILEKDLLLNKGVPYDFKSEVGFVADRVKDHAEKNEVEFLVIGKSSNAATTESLEDIMEKTQVPLVVVP